MNIFQDALTSCLQVEKNIYSPESNVDAGYNILFCSHITISVDQNKCSTNIE